MQDRLKFNDAFENALERLNEQQQLAVNQLEGPVMVVAGPGTGKTQILAARIGKILKETDADASNILCLTYTDAGTVAMRKRLIEFIGPEAYRVHIHTFHSFCNEVIQEHAQHFDKHSFDAISELELVTLMRRLIDELPSENVLKRFRGDVYFDIKPLIQLFSTMKQEGYTTEFILQKTDEYISAIKDSEPGTVYYKKFKYVKNSKNNKPGDFKPDFLNEEDRMLKLKAAAQLFPKFQQMMVEANRYDFDDMINWVNKLFTSNERVLSTYQERYQYILVDEYQDTSGSQNQLVNQLISYWDSPNIFVVGDDDQSIYRFQGANVENILNYANTFVDQLNTIVLTKNYRSTQAILDVSKHLIENNNERLIKKLPSLSKDLIAHNTENTIVPRITEYYNPWHEYAEITRQVEELIENEKVDPTSIAIIYKQHKYGEELANYFSLANIPVNAKKSSNLLQEPLAQQIIRILRYISYELDTPFGGEELLFEIMHYRFFDIPAIEIAKITAQVADNRNYQNKTISLRTKIHHIAKNPPDKSSDAEASQSIAKFSNNLEDWIKEAHNLTLQGLLEKIITKGGILAYILNSDEPAWNMQILTSLFDYVKEVTHLNSSMHLKQFIENIELMESNKLLLPIHKNIINQKGVNFLTCHGSKGLEFDYVFLIGCESNNWEKKRGNNNGYKLPDTIFTSQDNADTIEELRRLFYVAITRAKKYLYLSYSSYDFKGKELTPSIFITEISQAESIEKIKTEVELEKLLKFLQLRHSEEQKPLISLFDTNYINKKLESFTLSVTALNNYLDCPLNFYFQNLVRVPASKSESMTFGTCIHYALQKLFDKMLDNTDKNFPHLIELIEDFEWKMHVSRESFTATEFERRLDYGHQVLQSYYNKYINSWNKTVLTEKKIGNVEVNGVPIKGMLDKLEFTGKTVNVVDYKTGKYDNAKTKLNGPDEKNPLGGSYWRQAIFYKILVENDRTNDWQVISSEFDFVEHEKEEFKKGKVVITSDDVETVKQQITSTWSAIQNHEFRKGCGKEDCKWCNFVKGNYDGIPAKSNEEE